MRPLSLPDLLAEHAAAQAYSLALVDDLTADELAWRPHEHSSPIAWHLGHQAAVNHYLVRNLTAAEPSFDADLDAVFDSATPEPARGGLPPLAEIVAYRDAIAGSTREVITRIGDAQVGAPAQLARIADRLMRAVIDHEYQHAKWVEEVRATMRDDPAPGPASTQLVAVEGYWMLG
ncbi:MAG: DinB family protein [Ilumatobacter sp.]|nr:DinB family protein [Ilumatobacter sp.]